MKKILLPFIMLMLVKNFTSTVFSQSYSIRTNILNLVAKGPSVTVGKNVTDHSEVLLTYSLGNFTPFFSVDSYKYSTVHLEYRRDDLDKGKWKLYYGGYLRYIHKRILSEGYYAGPLGIFSKAPRNFTGNGVSLGLTSGIEYSIDKKLFVYFNTLLGAGKYLSQVDYSGHDKISMFFDTRIALQIGFRL